MPGNSTGQIAIVVDVVGQATAEFSTQDTLAHVSQIPTGGTSLRLPDELPGAGDRYEFADLDGTCGPASPITLTDPNGHPIAGALSQVFTAPFAWGIVVYDKIARAWSLQSSGASSSSSSGWGPWTAVAAGALFAPNNAERALLVDAGVPPGTQTQIEIPPAPVDGQILLVNDYLARSGANPILLLPPPGGAVGVAVFGAPGTFDAVGPVVVSFPGGTLAGLSMGLQFFSRDQRWIQWL